MSKKMTTASRLFRVFVATGKQLALTAVCGALMSGVRLAQDSPAIQPPQEPQPQQPNPQAHLRQGQPGVYQSF
ncbi:MAG: hypothetical protein H0T45_16470 [Pyrinomonadaceae bacterium]|nr:hypothetical protein [Pyrinomonadaceae bacterium]